LFDVDHPNPRHEAGDDEPGENPTEPRFPERRLPFATETAFILVVTSGDCMKVDDILIESSHQGLKMGTTAGACSVQEGIAALRYMLESERQIQLVVFHLDAKDFAAVNPNEIAVLQQLIGDCVRKGAQLLPDGCFNDETLTPLTVLPNLGELVTEMKRATSQP